MIDNLNINPTHRILDESRIVPRMILWPRTGRAIVFAACFDRSLVKRIHKLVCCAQIRQPEFIIKLSQDMKSKRHTPRRKREVFALQDGPQRFLVPFDAGDPEEWPGVS